MQGIDDIQLRLLEEIAGLHEVPEGAFNIRANGQLASRQNTAHIEIVSKEDGSGIDIHIKPHTKKESVHIPVVLSKSGLKETVYNDFYIGEDCDVVIVAGCGIDNCGTADTQHDGIHRFFVGKGSKVKYVEKHYGSGNGKGERIMNPTTEVHLDEDSYMEMEMVQIKGVDSTQRSTVVDAAAGAKLVIQERLLTHGTQHATSEIIANLNGEGSSANILSRSVAKENSNQIFLAKIFGNAPCAGHTECDAIIMDNAKVSSIPEITANDPDAALIHEAAIGKIAGEQIIKLMTLGLTEEEAENQDVYKRQSKRFTPPAKIEQLAKYAEPFVSTGNQSGEGWFLTGEMIELIHSGAKNIVCTQPFACLPNHVVGKGVILSLIHIWRTALCCILSTATTTAAP